MNDFVRPTYAPTTVKLGKVAAWPQWVFRGEEMRLIKEGEEIPEGWHDAPSKFNGADPAKFDHDGDSRPGGSMSTAPVGAAMTEPSIIQPPVDVASLSDPLPIKRGPGRPRKHPLPESGT